MKKICLIALFGLMFTGCAPLDFATELCGGYILGRTSSHDILIMPKSGWDDTTPIIPPKVVELGNDQRFIVAKQHPLKRRSPDNLQDTYMEPDRGLVNYWILDTATPIAFGPLMWDEYIEKRKELDVPDSVILKGVNEYR